MGWLYWLLGGWFLLALGMAGGWCAFRKEFRNADDPPEQEDTRPDLQVVRDA